MRKSLAIVMIGVLAAVAAVAKDKKSNLPELVLRATRVMVVIDSAGTSLTGDDQQARVAVERALEKWGRFKVVYFANESDPPDLVIALRKGGTIRPVLTGRSPNDRPGTIDSTDSTVSIGVSRGTPPPLTGGPLSTGTLRVGTEAGSSDDTLAVYDGRMSHPLDMPALWRYSGRDALLPPTVRAVEEFRKAIEASEKARQKTKKP